MVFIKRQLSEAELSGIDFDALGVEPLRVPPVEWDWAVDETKGILFTQLLSSGGEMREGDYRYLLLTQSDFCIIGVEAWGGRVIENQLHLKAKIERPKSFCHHSVSEIERLASDAMQIVSVKADRLSFPPRFSSNPLDWLRKFLANCVKGLVNAVFVVLVIVIFPFVRKR